MTGPSRHSLELHAGALRLALRPDLGGSIAGLWHGQTPVMRSTEPDELATSRRSACYPLVPYSNRLAHRHFRWEGKEYTTAANFDDNPHSVHGVAWLRPWDIVSSGPVDAVLRYRHEPDAHWPFAFEVRQHFSLTADTLEVRLAFTNTSEFAQPAGLGWHPYFPKRPRSHIQADLSGRWESDPVTELPTRRVAQPGIDGHVADLDFNHCFDGWTGPARVHDEQLSMQLGSSVSRLVVYTPQDKPYFCVEPVTHVSDAIHMADPAANGLRTVQPSDTFEASMSLVVTATR
jgi:aldose 1-epimerase